MANADFTVHTISSKNWLAADTALSSATSIAQFVQGVTLRLPRGEDLNLNSEEVTGLYHVMQDLIDRIKQAKQLVEQGDGSAAGIIEMHLSQEADGAK